MTFEDRPRYTLEEAMDYLDKPSPQIRHLLDNQDGTYSVMGHINCEWCDYCDTEGQQPRVLTHYTPYTIHVAKADPYESRMEHD